MPTSQNLSPIIKSLVALFNKQATEQGGQLDSSPTEPDQMAPLICLTSANWRLLFDSDEEFSNTQKTMPHDDLRGTYGKRALKDLMGGGGFSQIIQRALIRAIEDNTYAALLQTDKVLWDQLLDVCEYPSYRTHLCYRRKERREDSRYAEWYTVNANLKDKAFELWSHSHDSVSECGGAGCIASFTSFATAVAAAEVAAEKLDQLLKISPVQSMQELIEFELQRKASDHFDAEADDVNEGYSLMSPS